MTQLPSLKYQEFAIDSMRVGEQPTDTETYRSNFEWLLKNQTAVAAGSFLWNAGPRNGKVKMGSHL